MKTQYALFDQTGAFSRIEELDPAQLPPIPLADDGFPRTVLLSEKPEKTGKKYTPNRAGQWIESDAAPLPVPTNLPAWRIRVALKNRGLLTNVKTLIASLPNAQRGIAEEQFVDSRFERGHPLVEQLGKALNLTTKDLDDIFREADALV